MTTKPSVPDKSTKTASTWAPSLNRLSDASSCPDTSVTPEITPADTPREKESSNLEEHLNLEALETGMDDNKVEGSRLKEEVQPIGSEPDNAKVESKTQPSGETKDKKPLCKKHPNGSKKCTKKCTKKHKKARKDVSSSSSDSSSSDDTSSSSSSSEESTESDSSSDEDENTKKKRKAKARKARKLKEKRKAKSRKRRDSSDEESEAESSDETSSEEDEKRKKSRSKKKKSRKSRKEITDSESEEEEDDPVARARAQLNSLNIRRRARWSRGGRALLDDRQLKKQLEAKSKGKKRKRSVQNQSSLTVIAN